MAIALKNFCNLNMVIRIKKRNNGAIVTAIMRFNHGAGGDNIISFLK